MKKSLIIALVCSCTTLVNAQTNKTKAPLPAKAYQAANKTVSVYTTAQNTDYRITKTATLTFKQFGQPLETDVCIFVDPSKTFQSFLGIGGGIN